MPQYELALVMEYLVDNFQSIGASFGCLAAAIVGWRTAISRAKDVRKENLKQDLEIRRLVLEQNLELPTEVSVGLDNRVHDELDAIYNFQHGASRTQRFVMDVTMVLFMLSCALVRQGWTDGSLMSALAGLLGACATLWWMKKQIIG